MDKDLNELEQLAEGTHADLQEKPKKGASKEVNGMAVESNGNEDLATDSMVTLATDSQVATSAATLSEVQTMSAKQPSNRATL